MFSGEIALVTGASRGIGAAIADRLAAGGARVIGTATTPEGAARIGERLAVQGGRGAVLDVGQVASIEALIADIEGKEGAVSILCNNAGITRDTLLLRMKPEDWAAVIDTNLSSVFRLSKAVLRGMMKARKGRIVNITSIVGVTGNAGQVNYAAAKAGHPRIYQVARQGSRLARHHRECHRPGIHRHGHDPCPVRHAARGAKWPDPARPARTAGGHRSGSGLPVLRGWRLYHGRDLACERRDVHAVTPAILGLPGAAV